jgi:alpha-tubulin suppressor-like RCC1 family protein
MNKAAAAVNSVRGLTPAGGVYCCGNGDHGELGAETTISSPVPAEATSSIAFTSLARGYFHFCATATDGGLYCLGSNQIGEIGRRHDADSNSPDASGAGGTVTSTPKPRREHRSQ